MREKCYICEMSIRSNDFVVPYYSYPHINPDLAKLVHLRCCTSDTFSRIGDENRRIRKALGK